MAEARGRAGLTQAELASAIGLERSVLAKLELGQRRVAALELARIADALATRVEWFVVDAPQAVISRRNAQEPGAASPRIDAVVERISRSVSFLASESTLNLESWDPVDPFTTVAEAEAAADSARRALGLNVAEPTRDLAARAVGIGLLVFSVDLGTDTADAATMLLDSGGVCVVNGALLVGRRRLALAHEIAHYMVADEYTIDWRVAEYQDAERREALFDRFARALLLPESGLQRVWSSRVAESGVRIAAVRTASEFRVDMTTLARRLYELSLTDRNTSRQVRTVRTTRTDIVENDLYVSDELEPPSLPRPYERAVLQLYRNETVSSARALDLLLDTWQEDMLPELPQQHESSIWQYV